jgi:hypothetical protein
MPLLSGDKLCFRERRIEKSKIHDWWGYRGVHELWHFFEEGQLHARSAMLSLSAEKIDNSRMPCSEFLPRLAIPPWCQQLSVKCKSSLHQPVENTASPLISWGLNANIIHVKENEIRSFFSQTSFFLDSILSINHRYSSHHMKFVTTSWLLKKWRP